MKNAILGFTYTLLIVYMFIINVSIMQKDVRQSELDNSVNLAARQTMEYAYQNNSDGTLAILNDALAVDGGTIQDYTEEQLEKMANRELKKLFTENFKTQINSNGAYIIEVVNADVKGGILDVKVTRKFPYLFTTDADRKTIKEEKNLPESQKSDVAKLEAHVGTVTTRRTVIQHKAQKNLNLTEDTDQTS